MMFNEDRFYSQSTRVLKIALVVFLLVAMSEGVKKTGSNFFERRLITVDALFHI